MALTDLVRHLAHLKALTSVPRSIGGEAGKQYASTSAAPSWTNDNPSEVDLSFTGLLLIYCMVQASDYRVDSIHLCNDWTCPGQNSSRVEGIPRYLLAVSQRYRRKPVGGHKSVL